MFNNSTYIDLGLGSRVRILEGFGLTLVFFISLMLNISVCVIIWTTKPLLAKPSNILVGNLCIANLLLTACGIPFSLVTIIKDQHDAYSHSILCQGNGFISVTSSFAIVMTLCCICLDRYIAVTRPTRYKVIVTIKRSKFALVVVWCEGLLHASFPLLGWSKYVYHKETLHCSPKWTHNCSIYVYLAVIGFGLPIVSMVFTYIRIVSVMRKHTRKVLTVRQRGLDGEKKESTSELISMTPRQSMDRNSSVPAKQEVQEKLPSSTQNPSRSEGVEAVSSSLMKICSIESYSCEPTDQKVEKCVTACKLTPGNAIINSRSPRQRFQCLSLRNILIRYFPKKQCGQNMQPLTKEWKVAKTGVILLVSFIVLWLPYMVVHTCSARFKAPQVVFRLSMWLVFMNGLVNPVAYAFGNSRVKMKFQKWFSTIFFLFCKCRRKEHNNRNLKTSDR